MEDEKDVSPAKTDNSSQDSFGDVKRVEQEPLPTFAPDELSSDEKEQDAGRATAVTA